METNRMNNDNRANDANHNGGELFVGLTETERQELLSTEGTVCVRG